MLSEMHAHTSEHSNCSRVRALALIRLLHARGFKGLMFTDHHYLWQPEEIREIRRNSGVPEDFFVFSGQEVSTRDMGDVLVYGADRSVPRGSSLPEIRTLYPEAALVLAHPYRNGKNPAPGDLLSPLIDAVEIFNSNHTVSENSRGLKDWRRHKFTAIGGTDTHGVSYAGTYPTVFDHPVESVTALAEAVKKGRCRPFLKKLPKNDALLQVAEISGSGAASPRDRIVIKSTEGTGHWKSAERAYRIMEVLYQSGFDSGRYRVPRPIDRDEESMTLMEQALDGRTLYEATLNSDLEDARHYVQLAALWLASLHNSRLQISPQEIEGAAIEGLVAQHLRAWNAYGGDRSTLFFWRTKSGNEVDFVIYGENVFCALEVKNTARVNAKMLQGLLAFKEDYPEAQILFLYRGKEHLKMKEVLCLPVEEFLMNLRPDKPLWG
jgi:hypothetical protein